VSEIVTTRSPAFRKVMQRRDEIKRAEEGDKAWEALRKIGTGVVPYNEVVREYSRDVKSILPDNAWKGRRCFIVGGGPSLKGFNFARLDQELTIAVNRAFEVMSPSVILWGDYVTFYRALMAGEFGGAATRRFQSSAAMKVAVNISAYEYPPDVYPIRATPAQNCVTHSLSDGLGTGGNSGYAALNFAVCLGASPIYLLGFDMKGDGEGHQAWFHSGYKSDQGSGVYKHFISAFEEAAPIIEGRGIEVVNLNPKSAMKCFPTGDINKLRPPVRRSPAKTWAGTKERDWIVISFYTRETSYAKEVKGLITSLRKFGLPYHIFGFKPVGSWRANLNYKSACILQAMELYPDKDIVFIDADGIVRQDPVLFDELSKEKKYHIGAVFHKFHPRSGDPDELLSGTLWLQNNGVTRGLIKLWHQIALEEPLVIHQRCLKYAIEKLKQNGNAVKVLRMPWAYTHVFDYARGRGKQPVIEHFQASRRFRDEVGRGAPLIKGVQM